jgi:hypothetical protein
MIFFIENYWKWSKYKINSKVSTLTSFNLKKFDHSIQLLLKTVNKCRIKAIEKWEKQLIGIRKWQKSLNKFLIYCMKQFETLFWEILK